MFGVASLACAYSSSSGELIAARAVLGLTAAAILPLALAVLPVMFTPAERPRAIAIVGGATFLGYPLGPILGGWLLDNFWWGSVFLINVPIVILALAAVTFLMPESRNQGRFRIDVTGVVISSAGLAALTYGLSRPDHQDGWSDTAAVATIAAGRRAPGAVCVVGAPGRPATRRAAARRPRPSSPTGFGHDEVGAGDEHVRVARADIRDAAVLSRRQGPGLAGQRRADAGASSAASRSGSESASSARARAHHQQRAARPAAAAGRAADRCGRLRDDDDENRPGGPEPRPRRRAARLRVRLVRRDRARSRPGAAHHAERGAERLGPSAAAQGRP